MVEVSWGDIAVNELTEKKKESCFFLNIIHPHIIFSHFLISVSPSVWGLHLNFLYLLPLADPFHSQVTCVDFHK